MKKLSFLLPIAVFLLSGTYAQNEHIEVGIVGEKFSDFTLTTFQGNEVSTKNLKGKNILLISSRGKYNDAYWCGLCFYQYAEFAELELTQQIRQKYNMEILFLLPYSSDTLASWKKSFTGGLAYIESKKNPANPDELSEDQQKMVDFVRNHYPKSFNYVNDQVPLPLPILADEKQEVSSGLDLMRMEWGGTNTLQNVPAVYFIDEEGILKFKYISQSTIDRPSAEYILDLIDKMEVN